MSKRILPISLLAFSMVLQGSVALAASVPIPFCQTFLTQASKVQTKVTNDQRNLKDVAATSLSTSNDSLRLRQLRWDQVTDERIAQLEQNATKGQLGAVQTFKDHFHQAVLSKRTTSKSLMDKYQGQVLKMNTDHLAAQLLISSARGQALLTAATAAQQSCQKNPTSSGAIQVTYNQKVRDAQALYRTANAAEDRTYAGGYSQLLASRQVSEQAIQLGYAMQVKQAVEDLKKALGVN